MKKMLKTAAGVAAFGLSTIALAGGGGMAAPDDAGWYVGGGLGFGLSHWDNIETGAAATAVGKEDDFAARVYGGYNFNRTYAVEFGWTYLPSNVTVGGAPDLRNWAIDFSGKLRAPLMDQIGVFARLGVNYLKTTARGTLATASPLFGGATTVRNFNVTYGAGVYYDYSPQLRFTGEWQRFHGKSNFNDLKYQPFMDAFTVNVTYRLPEGLLI